MLQSITTNTCMSQDSRQCMVPVQHRTRTAVVTFSRARRARASPTEAMPSVQVLYFARAREVTGGLTEETFDAEDTDQLKAALTAKHPALASVLQSAVLAVNQEYVTERLTLRDRDEVAIIPPISGG